MAFLVSTAVDRLLALVNTETTDTNLPTGITDAALAAVLAACQDARTHNPALFAPRRRILLGAPAAITLTLAADKLTFSALTGTIPRAGCTILLNGEDYHIQVATLLTSTTGTLARACTGASGARTGTVWEDCWTPPVIGSATLDRIIGDVTANGRPIQVLPDPSELTLLARRTDFQADYPITPNPPRGGQWPAYPFQLWSAVAWGSGPYFTNELVEPGYREPYEGNQLLGCWVEYRVTAPGVAPEVMLRFAPMPSTVQVIDLAIVSTPHLATSDVGFPDGTQEVMFMPLALNQWMQTSYFKPDANQATAIRDNYKVAVSRLRNYRTMAGAQPYRAA